MISKHTRVANTKINLNVRLIVTEEYSPRRCAVAQILVGTDQDTPSLPSRARRCPWWRTDAGCRPTGSSRTRARPLRPRQPGNGLQILP